MNKYVKKYQKIVDELVKKGFPELKGKKIKIIEYNFTKTYGGFIPIINLFGIHKRSRNLSRGELDALLVHELCHMKDFDNMNFFKTFLWGILSNIPAFPRKKLESRVDKIVVRKGYARQRVVLANKKLDAEKHSKNYMSVEEIKSYAKKIGKWY